MKNHSVVANEPLNPSKFIHFYTVNVELNNGQINRYDMVSRHEVHELADLARSEGDAVTIIARSVNGDQMLVIREFRPAINGYVWAFPAGLIDADDSSFEDAAAREMKEETGYDFISIDDVIRPTYVSPGLTNESIAFVYVTVDPHQSNVHQHLEDSEDITVRWVHRDEADALLHGEDSIDQRMALVLHAFIREKE